MAIDVDAVSELIQHVAETVVRPRHRALMHGDVEEKSPGEVVTIVDREAELMLADGLTRLLPAVVVGEEAASSDPSLVAMIPSAPCAWLVDPLDGTANFVAGSNDFAIMVGLIEAGETVAAWILRPADRMLYVAERRSGARVNGRPLKRAPAPTVTAALRGAAETRFLSPEQRASVEVSREQFEYLGPGRVCAGVDYPLVAEGEQDFVLFWRTLPWDHAPGALVVTESGGLVAHLDGEPYRPGQARHGLLVASDPETHRRVVAALGL